MKSGARGVLEWYPICVLAIVGPSLLIAFRTTAAVVRNGAPPLTLAEMAQIVVETDFAEFTLRATVFLVALLALRLAPPKTGIAVTLLTLGTLAAGQDNLELLTRNLRSRVSIVVSIIALLGGPISLVQFVGTFSKRRVGVPTQTADSLSRSDSAAISAGSGHEAPPPTGTSD